MKDRIALIHHRLFIRAMISSLIFSLGCLAVRVRFRIRHHNHSRGSAGGRQGHEGEYQGASAANEGPNEGRQGEAASQVDGPRDRPATGSSPDDVYAEQAGFGCRHGYHPFFLSTDSLGATT